MRRACVGRRQTVQVLPTFQASSRRRATELSFRGAVMVFLVFLEVLEMSSEVVGPGPNTREIKSLRVDPGPRACALPPDAGCMLPFGLFVVLCVGVSSRGFLQGRRLGGALSRPCSCSTRFYSLQAAGGIGATLLRSWTVCLQPTQARRINRTRRSSDSRARRGTRAPPAARAGEHRGARREPPPAIAAA